MEKEFDKWFNELVGFSLPMVEFLRTNKLFRTGNL